MSKNYFSAIAMAFLLFTLVVYSGFSQEAINTSVRVMFYNVENLFDIYDDTTTDDAEFLPEGLRRWNYSRYTKKINSLYKTIVAAGEWSPPQIIGLCEVENRKVVEDLIYGTYLSKYNFSIIHKESPDKRGIDVCLLYNRDVVEIIDYCYWIPSEQIEKEFSSRSILYAKLGIMADTLHLFVNHWPSRRGGVLYSESLRKKIAGMIRHKIDSIVTNTDSEAKIVLMGDFNCSPVDRIMRLMVGGDESHHSLTNLSEEHSRNGEGTYRYKGVWEMIDQVIVSDKLLNTDKGLTTEPKLFNIFKPDFLLAKDPVYPGLSPFATYRGYRYQGGYSDHLPVLLDLKINVED